MDDTYGCLNCRVTRYLNLLVIVLKLYSLFETVCSLCFSLIPRAQICWWFSRHSEFCMWWHFFFVRDSNNSSYSIYLDIENQNFEIDNDPSFVSELESSCYSFQNSTYQNNVTKTDDSLYMIITCMILNIVGIITLIVALTVIFRLKSTLIVTFNTTKLYGRVKRRP